MTGILYIVATPIGNLEDTSLRTLRILKEVDFIAAEDTRVTKKLLFHFDIHTKLISYHQNSRGQKAEEILRKILDGNNCALVSDAGTPGISDPGFELINLCIENNIVMDSIPGPCAVITAIVLSGMPCSRFIFDGFPPRKESERRTYFSSIKSETRTICLYESPIRLLSTLKSAMKVLGDREVVVVREATKMFQEVFRGKISDTIAKFTQIKPRGEIVLILSGAGVESDIKCADISDEINKRLVSLMESGYSERDAVKECVAEFKIPKRDIYSLAIQLKNCSQNQI